MPFLRKATDNPFGFLPNSGLMQISPYTVDSGAAILYPGDALICEADGALGVAAAGSVNVIGVAMEYNPASTAASRFLVADHVLQEFVGQDDGDTGIMTATSIGANVDLLATTGDTTTRRSKHELDSSSCTTTATLVWKVKELHPIEGLSYASAVAQQRKWVVTINNALRAPYQQVGI